MNTLNIELEENINSTVRYTHLDPTTNLPINLTGYSAILQIRPDFGSDILISEFSTVNGKLVLGGTAGTVDINFVPTDTDQHLVPIGWNRGSYDLVLVDGTGKRNKVLKGFITIARSATQ